MNFLYSVHGQGAEASATVYSIVITAKLNGLNQCTYLKWVLTKMPNEPIMDAETLDALSELGLGHALRQADFDNAIHHLALHRPHVPLTHL